MKESTELSGNLGALPKVIAVETNTFAARVLRCQEFCGHG